MSQYKPYPAYKDSGVEWLGSIPQGWSISRLGFESWVRARLGWKGLKAEEYVDEGFAFLSTPNIKGVHIDFSGVNFISEVRYEESPEIKLSVGDVLLAKDGSTLGTVNVVRRLPRPTTVNSSIAVITPGKSLDSLFLFYLFKGAYLENTIQVLKGGMGVPHLFQWDINKFKIPLPSLKEQKVIAAHLDRETARIDALVEKKIRFIELLREKRQALITHAVTKGLDPNMKMKDSGVEWLGEVPEHWGVIRMRYAATLNPPIRKDLLEDTDREVSFLPMEAIGEDGALDLGQSRPVADVRNGYSYFEDGDVAFAKVTPCFENGKGALMHGLQCAAGFGTTELTVLRPNSAISNAGYINYIVRGSSFRAFGAGAMTGAGGLKRVPDEFTRNFPVALSGMDEQSAIVAYLDREVARIATLLDKTERSVDLLKERRSALITAAVTGQIDLRESA